METFRAVLEENLATKQDLELVRAELVQKIELARRDIIIRLGAIVIGAATVLGVFLGALIAVVQF